MIPVTVLTGFLGAGKTTLLRALLERPHGLGIGLVLNELGQAGIDEAAPAQTSMVELTEGCVCCLRNPDLLLAMDEMWERGDVDRIIIETTGLADPLSLTWTLARPELQGRVRLDAVVTVVDPLNYDKAAREEWEAQVRCGDLIVLSKTDVADPARIQQAIDAVRTINPKARILEGGERLPEGVLLDSLPEGEGPRSLGLERQEKARHSDFSVISIGGRDRYHLDQLEDWLEAMPEEIFRAKGVVRTVPEGWVSFHVVGGRLQIDTRAQAPAHEESRLALFGRGLSRGAIEEKLAAFRV